MERKKFIKVQGKIYLLLGMYGGVAHLGLPLDVNNESAKRIIIWESQPFFHEHEFGLKDRIYIQYCLLIRFFKSDVFGNSKFKSFLHKNLITSK